MPYMTFNRMFKRGEIAGICLATRKAEGPLHTREFALRVKGLDENDKGAAPDYRLQRRRADLDNAQEARADPECRAAEGHARLGPEIAIVEYF
jgi:hypothetical protein